jgi:hypothetical protein
MNKRDRNYKISYYFFIFATAFETTVYDAFEANV